MEDGGRGVKIKMIGWELKAVLKDMERIFLSMEKGTGEANPFSNVELYVGINKIPIQVYFISVRRHRNEGVPRSRSAYFPEGLCH